MPVTIPLVTDADLTPELRKVLDSLPALNIFRMLANAPANLKPFVDYGMSLLFATELDASADAARSVTWVKLAPSSTST